MLDVNKMKEPTKWEKKYYEKEKSIRVELPEVQMEKEDGARYKEIKS